jgi:glycosyltransferase involved in cell wall biosynthesis
MSKAYHRISDQAVSAKAEPGVAALANGQTQEEVGRLRAEIHAMRLENQQLRMDLDRFRDPYYIVRHMIRTGWSEALYNVRHTRLRLWRLWHPVNSAGYGSGFRPHRAQISRSLQLQRPRVLHVIANFHLGGSSRLVVDLMERLEHRFQQQVIVRDLPPAPAYLGIRLDQFERLTSPRPVFSYLRRFKPAIVHVHYLGHHNSEYSELDWKWYNNVFLAAEHYGCRLIENVNIPVPPYVSGDVGRYVYVSDRVRQEFACDHCPNTTIYPGSDLQAFSRKAAAIPDDCIGMVYRLERDKLTARSIDVFIEVVRRRPSTRVLIIGGGRYLESYQRTVEDAGLRDAFTFTGYISYGELPAVYEKMCVFVAPVARESFGQVVPFAMGMRIPVVGYNVGALPEILGDDSLLAPPGESGTLAEIVLALLNDRERRIQIGRNNHRRAQQLFGVEAMCNRYSDLYDELLTDAH